MPADFSRVRMNPLADLAGVELKQGGVLLDADFNEYVALVDRKLRALASDVLGRNTHSQATPDAFKLLPVAGGFTIGRGRHYVDGLLAENHGRADATQRGFDPLLAETVYSQDPSYAQQPWLQPAPALPSAGRHLVYLDVWQRALTHVEEPDLVEPAVGVDTSSRLQTVWQVRVLGDEAPVGATCASPDADIPGWANLIAPSTGRLSTGVFDVADVADPCELPPGGGYTGLENQLYRVEVHEGGAPGTATFKWSRDNASIASRVATRVSATELELDTLGRDEVLRFRIGDWVEITNDERELAQGPGDMRKIADIDEANRRIRLAHALTAPLSSGPLNGLRVRRWDQARKVYRTGALGSVVEVQDLDAATSTGVIRVPASDATQLLLENGVTVRFASVGAKGFRTGDWWVFAARTADGSVEVLDAEPPRGTHHHYARLGFWDLGAGTISDCRGPWPPEGGGHDCSCTACVTPETHASGAFTVQDAINQVREARGGTVCLAVGRYVLRAPLNLAGVASLRLRGQGPGTLLIAPGTALDIRSALAVAVERLSILSVGMGSAIVTTNVLGLALTELAIAVLGNADAEGAAIALQGAVLGARIENNWILAPHGLRALEPARDDDPRVLLCAALTVQHNLLWCERTGVVLEGPVLQLLETRLAGNQVLGCRERAFALLGLGAPGSAARITGNTVQAGGSGIVCGVNGAWVEGNKLGATGSRGNTIGIELATGLDHSGSDQAQVLSNQVSGYTLAAIAVRAPVQLLVCKLNILEGCGNGILMTDDGAGGAVAIENNLLRDIGNAADAAMVVGIGLARVDGAAVSGNSFARVGNRGGDTALRAGILGIAVTRLRAHGNQLSDLGPPDDFGGLAAGILLGGPYLQLDVQHNQIERDSLPTDRPGRGAWFGLFVGGSAQAAAEPNDRLVATRYARVATVPVDARSTLVVSGNKAFVALAAAIDAGGGASVLGNVFTARSTQPAVLLLAERECLFSDNRVDHSGVGGQPAVRLLCPLVIANGNRVRNRSDIALDIPLAKTVAAVANITTGILRAPGLKPEFEPLNLRA
jgi:hypothetical protein